MKKYLLIAIAILSLTGAALAALPLEPQGYALPFYWLSGQVTSQDAAVPDGRTVYFYRGDQPENYISTTTVGGAYNFNVYDLYFAKGVPIALGSPAYVLQVLNDGSGWVTTEAVTLTTAQGYTIKDLALTAEGGVVPPYGTVPLTIERVADTAGSAVKISWNNTNYPSPRIFMLTGDGTGQFTNATEGWIEITSGAEGFNYGAYSTGSIANNSQVGGGYYEAYYKATQNGIDPQADSPEVPGKKILETAWAVGKLNYVLTAGKDRLINVPFNMTDAAGSLLTIQNTVGSQFANGRVMYTSGGSLLTNNLASGVWAKPNLQLSLATGYWLMSSVNKTITFVGQVQREEYSKSLLSGYELYGYPLPMSVDLTSLGIPPVANDKILYEKGGSLLSDTYKSSGGWSAPTWVLTAEAGFWYKNGDGSARNLNVVP